MNTLRDTEAMIKFEHWKLFHFYSAGGDNVDNIGKIPVQLQTKTFQRGDSPDTIANPYSLHPDKLEQSCQRGSRTEPLMRVRGEAFGFFVIKG